MKKAIGHVRFAQFACLLPDLISPGDTTYASDVICITDPIYARIIGALQEVGIVEQDYDIVSCPVVICRQRFYDRKDLDNYTHFTISSDSILGSIEVQDNQNQTAEGIPSFIEFSPLNARIGCPSHSPTCLLLVRGSVIDSLRNRGFDGVQLVTPPTNIHIQASPDAALLWSDMILPASLNLCSNDSGSCLFTQSDQRRFMESRRAIEGFYSPSIIRYSAADLAFVRGFDLAMTREWFGNRYLRQPDYVISKRLLTHLMDHCGLRCTFTPVEFT